MLYFILATVLVVATNGVTCDKAAPCSTSGDVCRYTDDNTPAECCTPTTGVCPAIFDPVCCDGTQYSNQCGADLNCASKCVAGPCIVDPQGQSCSTTNPCPDGYGCLLGKCAEDCGGISPSLFPCDSPAVCRYTDRYPDAMGLCCTVNTGPCTLEYAPMCCEGTTYGNPCQAVGACANYCRPGECCGGKANTLCPNSGDVCQYMDDVSPMGACCTPDPPGAVCTLQYDPVCCEGTQYGNLCQANYKCASRCVSGECPTDTKEPTTTADPTGQDCSQVSDCPLGYACASGKCVALCGGIAGLKCDSPAICRVNERYPDAMGVCCTVNTFGMCTLEYAPVCCDGGAQYNNQCGADLACANYCNKGECCGGKDDKQCTSRDDICRYQQPGNEHGVCCTKPSLAICTADYTPVCCDGTKYSNQCNAEAQCASYCTAGECPEICGGAQNIECSAVDDICRYERMNDDEGICCTKPDSGMCTLEYAPVCCDGINYGNACAAGLECASRCVAGACPEKCGREIQCKNEKDICQYESVGDESGICCATVSSPCIEIYDPYCCDGIEHSNKCFASAACASFCTQGQCEAPETTSNGGETTGAGVDECDVWGWEPQVAEELVCEFCFGKRKIVPNCKGIKKKIDWTVDFGDMSDFDLEDRQCMLDYCAQTNKDLDGCDLGAVRFKKDARLNIKDSCGCDLFECDIDWVATNDNGQLRVFVGIGFILAVLSWM